SAVSATFLTAPPQFTELLESDAVVADADARFPGLRPVLHPDLFTALVRSVTAQQLSLRWAAVVRRRIAEAFGKRHELGYGSWLISLSPEPLSGSRPEDLRALQLSGRQSAAIIGIAQACIEGRLDQRDVAQLPAEEVIAQLVQLPGIGRWTAEWILVRTFCCPVVVAGDLGVR